MSLTPTTPTGLQSGIPPLIALTMEAFMNMHLPERGFLLHPVIPAQGIVILFAPRGIGKTFTALSAALAVAGTPPIPNRCCMWMGRCPLKPCRTD